jgi:hypothetical protein
MTVFPLDRWDVDNNFYKVIPPPVFTVDDSFLFGSGSDGDLVVENETLTLTRDLDCNSLTLKNNGYIFTNNNRIFVKEFLDLKEAMPYAIRVMDLPRGDGNNSTGSRGVAVNGQAIPSRVFLGCCNGSNGETASIGNSSVQWYNSLSNAIAGGVSFGGGGGSTTAYPLESTFNASARGVSTLSSYLPMPFFFNVFSCGALTQVYGGYGGGGGASGYGNSSGMPGGGGGAGGNGGGCLHINTKYLITSADTPSNVISVNGFDGGNGANAYDDHSGGGGGGAGGGGGWIRLIAYEKLGPIVERLLTAQGGAGGLGGLGKLTGANGLPGCAGMGGIYEVYLVKNNLLLYSFADQTFTTVREPTPFGATL